MPDRIIRDELLRSHRFVGLSSDTLRLVFIAFVLCADDLGNAEATATAMGIMLVRHVPDEMAAKWIAELADADLIRTYESGGKRYVHIPRYRQRLRYPNGKHPRPPQQIECNEISTLADKVRPQSDRSQATVSLKTAEVKRSEVKRSEVNLKTGVEGLVVPPPSRARARDPKPKTLPNPETPILKIGSTIQHLAQAPPPPKTVEQKEADRARQLDYVAKMTREPKP